MSKIKVKKTSRDCYRPVHQYYDTRYVGYFVGIWSVVNFQRRQLVNVVQPIPTTFLLLQPVIGGLE